MTSGIKKEQVIKVTVPSRAAMHPPSTAGPTEPTSSGSTVRADIDMTMAVDEDSDRETVVGDSLKVLGRGVKELVQAVQSLRHLGVEDLILPLPKIVVVGDQSTGKSSLIEGICEIKVPRNAGTCTRCPLEINLTQGTSEQWSCKVSLHTKFMYTGQLGTSKGTGTNVAKVEGATKAKPLGPWAPQESEDFHFATITSSFEVEKVLYLAQLAVLNPRHSHDHYAYAPGKPRPLEEYQVKFSPNVIRLDISGRDLPNLSFYDLPGIINVSDVPEEAYLVDLVKNLVKGYANAKNCINLLAIPMTDDPANSSASRLLRDMQAEWRTVGCLTKPDRMQSGESLEQWIQILRGNRFRLGYGYHVIKNNPDPRVDHATARREEAIFFNEQVPWMDTLAPYSERFGTVQLQTTLSRLLTAQIKDSLPNIIEQVESKREVIDAGLKALPEPLTGNLPAIVMGELVEFERDLEKYFDGGSHLYLFQKEWNQLAIRFRQALAETRPTIMLQTPRTLLSSRETPNGYHPGISTPGPRAPQSPIVEVIDDSDDDNTIVSPSPTIKRVGNKRPRPSSDSPNKLQRSMNSLRQAPKPGSKCFGLEEVRTIIKEAYPGGIPGQVDPKAIERMIKDSMQHWEAPLADFLTQTKALLENMVFDRVQIKFGHRRHTKFFDKILNVCRTFIEGIMAVQLQVAQQLLGYEMAKPYTLNDRMMGMARDEALTLLQNRRRDFRAADAINEQEAKLQKFTEGQQRADKVAKFPDNQLQPELYQPELKAMSEAKGYYECAYSRFVDSICVSVHVELFMKCRYNIVTALKDEIGIVESDANERLATLLAVNAEDEERRAQLKKDMETIIRAQEQLEALA